MVPPDKVKSAFRYWRTRLLWSTYIGYAVFYFVRVNMNAVVPLMCKDLGVRKDEFGVFFTLQDIAYGISKYFAGTMADRFNPRYLVSGGLFLSAICNLLFGSGNWVVFLGLVWVCNGLVQGFGFPPCARVLSYWFSPKERGMMWGIFNTSHQVGAMLILAFAGWLGHKYGWRYAFWVPAVIALATSIFLFTMVRDTPASLGLPDVEVYTGEKKEGHVSRVIDDPKEIAALVRRLVYRNPAIWLICIANFFVYIVRGSFLKWAPTYLYEVKHVQLHHANLMTSGYELAGLVGCLVAGWVTDRFLGARRAPACVACMAMCTVFIFMLWQAPVSSSSFFSDSGGFVFSKSGAGSSWSVNVARDDGKTQAWTFDAESQADEFIAQSQAETKAAQRNFWYSVFCIAGVGFAIYGPQFLVGVMMADLATKRAAGTAVGLSGLFGYASSVVAGWGVGKVAEDFGWDAAFYMFMAASVISIIPFALCWKAGPVYEED